MNHVSPVILQDPAVQLRTETTSYDDSDGLMTASSGIDAVSLSDSSLGSEVLESLSSSPVEHKHDD